MFSRALVALLLVLAGGKLSAQTSPTVIGLYNTGTLVAGKSPYFLQNTPTGAFALYEPAPNVWPLNGPWLADTVSTQWLAVYPGTTVPTGDAPTVPAGSYTIRLNFDLGTYNPAQIGFTIKAAADNTLTTVRLNGLILPNLGTPVGDTNYGSLGSYLYTVAGTGLKAGANAIDFVLTNSSGASGNPAGLYVEYSAFTSVVPEPSTWALIAGIAALGFAIHRRRKG